MRYSGFKVIKEALTGHRGWKSAWRDPEPQAHYDIVIIGGGGHGLGPQNNRRSFSALDT